MNVDELLYLQIPFKHLFNMRPLSKTRTAGISVMPLSQNDTDHFRALIVSI